MKKNFSTEELEQKAEEIMEYFNFDKVHSYMVEADHRWYNSNNKMEVPTLEEIRHHARSLLTQAIHDKGISNIGSGGFTVYSLPWGLELTFNLEHAHA